jgi:hypothetical protein
MPNAWVTQWFSTPALQQGKPARRKITSVLKHTTEATLIQDTKNANLILMKTPTQYVLFPTNHFTLLAGP